jgi:hypothetical protein
MRLSIRAMPRHGHVSAKAEREVRQVVEPALVLRSSPLRKCVARMKPTGPARSGGPDDKLRKIRDGRCRFDLAPGFRCAPPELRKKKKDSEAKRRQTQGSSAVRSARPRLKREAHDCRRSTTVLAPRSVSSQGTQPQARLPGTRRNTFCVSFERVLPAPACPSPAKAPRAPVVVPER